MGFYKFSQSLGAISKSYAPESDMKHISCWGPKNVRGHPTKSCNSGFVHPWDIYTWNIK